MQFEYTEDERDLSALARKILTSYPPSTFKQGPGDGPSHSSRLWAELAGAGLLGLGIDERFGGSGGTVFELGLVFREAGRAAAPTTLDSTVFAGLLIDALGDDDQRATLLAPLCAGEQLWAVAVAERGIDSRADLVRTSAVDDGDGWRLDGEKTVVENGGTADILLVAARVKSTGAIAYFALQGDAAGLTREPVHTLDQQAAVRVILDGVHAEAPARLSGPASSEDLLAGYARCDEVFTALRAMELLGLSERVLEVTADYVTERQQFGRPIGSFQAVQHIVANMAMLVATGSPTAHRAVWLLGEGRESAEAVAVAGHLLGQVGTHVTLYAHQLHGGMGFALESDLYLWSQRAKSLAVQLGSRGRQLDVLADKLLPAGSAR